MAVKTNSEELARLRALFGKRFLSYCYDYYFDDKQIANPAGIECSFEDCELIFSSDIKYFDFLDGEDYSYFKILNARQSEFNTLKQYPKREHIPVNQIIQDIQIITDTYHCINQDEKIDAEFVCDYTLIIVLERSRICFEKFDISETEIIIHNVPDNRSLQLFDSSSDFDEPELYQTKRKRVHRSLIID